MITAYRALIGNAERADRLASEDADELRAILSSHDEGAAGLHVGHLLYTRRCDERFARAWVDLLTTGTTTESIP